MENIQEKMSTWFHGLCYGYCLCYKFGVQSQWEMTKILLECWRRGYINNDGFVEYPLKVIKLICGKDYRDVEKVYDTTNYEEALNIVEYKIAPTCKGSHFVVCDREGNVVFDPSGDSNTVKKGIPFSWRRYVSD